MSALYTALAWIVIIGGTFGFCVLALMVSVEIHKAIERIVNLRKPQPPEDK